MDVTYALRRAHELHPDAIAAYDGGRPLTFAHFGGRVARMANALREMGIQRGDRVAVLMLNSVRYFELYHAVPLAGAIIVPMNIRWNPPEIHFALSDSGTRLLVVDDYFARVQPALSALMPGLQYIFAGNGTCPAGMANYEESLAVAAPAMPETRPDDGDVVALFYTSGSTGGPKGVMLTHKNLYANAIHGMVALAVTKEWVWLHAAPMFHVADATVVYSLVMQGAQSCFIPMFDPEACLKAIQQYRVTHMFVVPTMLNALVNHPAFDGFDTSSLRMMIYGASPMPLDLLRRAREKLPHCGFAQGYGLTEASPTLTYLGPEDHRLDNADERYAPVRSAGRALMGVELRVVDAMDRTLPPGVAGEVLARGDNVMKGYWNQPAITADTLRGGWLHTGDIGTFDARGYLFILDRKKDMIKPGGENVYSPEVESMIASHPEVLEVAVIGIPDEKWGEAIKAAVVRRPGSTLTAEALIEYCRERMAHFKCPTSVDFLEALPKGGTGKIQKTVLRQSLRA